MKRIPHYSLQWGSQLPKKALPRTIGAQRKTLYWQNRKGSLSLLKLGRKVWWSSSDFALFHQDHLTASPTSTYWWHRRKSWGNICIYPRNSRKKVFLANPWKKVIIYDSIWNRNITNKFPNNLVSFTGELSILINWRIVSQYQSICLSANFPILYLSSGVSNAPMMFPMFQWCFQCYNFHMSEQQTRFDRTSLRCETSADQDPRGRYYLLKYIQNLQNHRFR